MCNIAEYEALRATIRERGTVRLCAILGGVVAWAVLTLGLNIGQFERATTLVPFLVLAATFEINFFIHTGVERIGRYLQVYFEDEAIARGEPAGWENTIMAYGRNNPGGPDPLFVTLFAFTTALSFLGSLTTAARHPGWIAISFVAHLILSWRLVTARRLSANQRASDLARFRAIKNSSSSKELV